MFGDINEFARDTGWLHGTLLGFAKYGVVVFAVSRPDCGSSTVGSASRHRSLRC